MQRLVEDPTTPQDSRIPDRLVQPLREFLFETDPWLRPRAIIRALGSPAPAGLPMSPDSGWRRLLARAAPPHKLDADLLTQDLRGRLALLSRTDWLSLGLCVGVLPACGQIERSMDGHFRRVVRQLLDDDALQRLDRVVEFGRDKPVFRAGPGAWRSPAPLAAGGVRAIMAQVCLWPDPVTLRVKMRFEPEELHGPPSVSGLDITWLEIACEALWPDHPWLWN
jgi:hypothetical protein